MTRAGDPGSGIGGIAAHARGALLGLLVALGMAGAAFAAPAEITGTVNWGADTRVPPGARVTVRLIDAGQPEGAVELASIVLLPGEKGPLVFRLLYDTALIAAQGSYRLTARMTVGGHALMESLRATPVLTTGGTADPEILLERIAISAGAGDQSPVGRRWKLVSILDEPVDAPVMVSLTLDPNGTAHGSTGCNDFRATYEISPQVLDFGAFRLTKRGCQSPIMKIERRAINALEDVRGWRINDGELLLTDAAGTVMMRLGE